jgi:excisionase family DNA binding protein
MEHELYDISQVATYFRVREETIRVWVKQGLLEGFRAGRDWRFSKQEVGDCVERLREKSRKRAVAV